jgi:hypothetical protein
VALKARNSLRGRPIQGNQEVFMTTRIESNGPSPLVSAGPTAARTTDQPTRPFQAVLQAGASAVVTSAEAAVRRLPGGPILAAAFRPASGQVPEGGVAGGAPVTTPEGVPIASGSAPTAGGSPEVETMLGENSDRNLYYIVLQERISAENRQYTAYSNVLRARHETMKNAIGNFR